MSHSISFRFFRIHFFLLLLFSHARTVFGVVAEVISSSGRWTLTEKNTGQHCMANGVDIKRRIKWASSPSGYLELRVCSAGFSLLLLAGFLRGKIASQKDCNRRFHRCANPNDIFPKSGVDDFYFTVMYLLIPRSEHLPRRHFSPKIRTFIQLDGNS